MRQFEPGLARVEPDTLEGSENTMYYHTDHLGTTRLMSDDSGYAAIGWHDPINGPDDLTPSVFTAFGEHITGPHDGESNRYGYVGAHGYQAHDTPIDPPMPFLHVGHRYYDPASGRFLQRDPIGISSGTNVYVYIDGVPTIDIDPTGLSASAAPQTVRVGPPWWFAGMVCVAVAEKIIAPAIDAHVNAGYAAGAADLAKPFDPTAPRPPKPKPYRPPPRRAREKAQP